MFWKSLFVKAIGSCVLAISAGSYLLKMTSNVHFTKRSGIKQPEFVFQELIGVSLPLGSSSPVSSGPDPAPESMPSNPGGPGVDSAVTVDDLPIDSNPSPSREPAAGQGELKDPTKDAEDNKVAKGTEGVEQAGTNLKEPGDATDPKEPGQQAQELKASTSPLRDAVEQQDTKSTVFTGEQAKSDAVVSGEKPDEPQASAKQPEATTVKTSDTSSAGGLEDKTQVPSTPTTTEGTPPEQSPPPTTGGTPQAPSGPSITAAATQEKDDSRGEGSGGVQRDQVSSAQASTNESATGHKAPLVLAPSTPVTTGESQKSETPTTPTAPERAKQNLPASNSVGSGDRATLGTVNNTQQTPPPLPSSTTVTGGTPKAPSAPTSTGSDKKAPAAPGDTGTKQITQAPSVQGGGATKSQAPAAPVPTKPTSAETTPKKDEKKPPGELTPSITPGKNRKKTKTTRLYLQRGRMTKTREIRKKS